MITFGSFTVEETIRILQEADLHIQLPVQIKILSNQFSEKLISKEGSTRKFNQIILQDPCKNISPDTIVCKRCYRTSHCTYDCFSKKTITGIKLPNRCQIVIHQRSSDRNRAKHKELPKPRYKTAQEIHIDAEINSALPYLYWITQSNVINHAQVYIGNNMELYGTY